MTVPLATTTITVRRPPTGVDPDDPDSGGDATTIATGVNAHISAPSGNRQVAGGNREQVDAVLGCDPCTIASGDLVDDAATSETWMVKWARQRVGLGLDHTEAGLVAVTGESR